MGTLKKRGHMGYKYELTDETRYGLKRLKITTDNDEFIGGFVNNLARVSGNAMVYSDAKVVGNALVCGDARIYGNAMVYGDAKVTDDAEVYDEAEVCGHAEVYSDAKVCGNARVSGNANVSGNARVCSNARIYGDAVVSGYALVCGNARVSGNAMVYGDAKVIGNSKIEKTSDYLVIGPIGSRDDFITFTNSYDGILVTVGCFHGTLAEFKEKVKQTHGDNKHAKAYLLACDLAEQRICGEADV